MQSDKFQPMLLLIGYCPECQKQNHKVLVTRRRPENFACCPRCGHLVRPNEPVTVH